MANRAVYCLYNGKLLHRPSDWGTPRNYCYNTKVKRSWFGLGPRYCRMAKGGECKHFDWGANRPGPIDKLGRLRKTLKKIGRL